MMTIEKEVFLITENNQRAPQAPLHYFPEIKRHITYSLMKIIICAFYIKYISPSIKI